MAELYLPVVDKGHWMSYGVGYSAVHDAETAPWKGPDIYCETRQIEDGTGKFEVRRTLQSCDLTELSPALNITEAVFVHYGYLRASHRDIKIVIVDGTDIPENDSGFGLLLDRTVDLGHLVIPQGTAGWQSVEIPFNEAGINLLKSAAGGSLKLGLRVDQDILDVEPAPGERQQLSGNSSSIRVTYAGAEGYALKIEITPEEGGEVEVSPDKYAYDSGEEVTLTAIPAEGYTFLGWTGDAIGEDSPITIVMDSDKTVMANFGDSGIPDIPIIGEIIAWIEAKLKALWDWLKSQFTWIVNTLKDIFQAILDTVLAPIVTAIDWLKEKFLDAWTWITETIPAALEWLKAKVLDVWSWITTAIPAALNWIEARVADVWSWVTTAIPAALDWIRERINELFTKVGEIAASVADFVKNIIDTVTEALSSFFAKVGDTVSLIFPPLLPVVEKALSHSSQAVKDEVMSWWPKGTTIWDWIKFSIKFAWFGPLFNWDIIHEENLSEEERLRGFMNSDISEPIAKALKDFGEKLHEIFSKAFGVIWEGLKKFFTEILPGWFKSLWEKIRAGLNWIWDKITDAAEWFLDEITKLIANFAPISPTAGMGTLKGVIKVALALAGGLGLMTLAGHLVHPIHSLGMEHISAMVYDMTNYKVLIGAGMGVIAAASIRTPLTWYFNAMLRPMIPSERDAAMMRSRQYITEEEYSQLLAYRGYPDMWHPNLDRLTETRVGYFALAAVARNGVFDRELFWRDLRRAGYAEEMITLLLNMYEKTSGETVQGMMSGAAIKRFKEGFTTEEQFYSELQLLGYSDTQWPVFLAAAQLDYAYDYLNDLVAAYRDAVRKGHISIDGYRGALLDLGMVPERVEGYVLRERARLKPDESLTPLGPPRPEYETDAGKVKVDTIRRERRKDIIDRNEEVAALTALGMPTGYAIAIADNDDARLAEKAGEE